MTCVMCNQRPAQRNSTLCSVCAKRDPLAQILVLLAYMSTKPKMHLEGKVK